MWREHFSVQSGQANDDSNLAAAPVSAATEHPAIAARVLPHNRSLSDRQVADGGQVGHVSDLRSRPGGSVPHRATLSVERLDRRLRYDLVLEKRKSATPEWNRAMDGPKAHGRLERHGARAAHAGCCPSSHTNRGRLPEGAGRRFRRP